MPDRSLHIIIEAIRTGSGELARQEIVLAAHAGDAGQFEPEAGAKAGSCRVAPEYIAALRAVRDKVGAWKAGDPTGTTGSFSFGLAGCATGGAGPAGDPAGSVYVRTEAGVAYLPLLRNLPIRGLAGAEILDAIDLCRGK